MSAAVALRRDEPREQPRLFALPTRTLDAELTAAWSDLRKGAAAVCPVCEGKLRPRWSAGEGAVGARCEDCGSTLD